MLGTPVNLDKGLWNRKGKGNSETGPAAASGLENSSRDNSSPRAAGLALALPLSSTLGFHHSYFAF